MNLVFWLRVKYLGHKSIMPICAFIPLRIWYVVILCSSLTWYSKGSVSFILPFNLLILVVSSISGTTIGHAIRAAISCRVMATIEPPSPLRWDSRLTAVDEISFLHRLSYSIRHLIVPKS
jgi:hypothetical protein